MDSSVRCGDYNECTYDVITSVLPKQVTAASRPAVIPAKVRPHLAMNASSNLKHHSCDAAGSDLRGNDNWERF